MNNFINIRMTSHNNLKIFNNIKHNTRYKKSLSEYSKMKNELICIERGISIQEFSSRDKDVTKVLYQNFAQEYKKDRKKHHILHKAKRSNRKVKESFGTWGEMVFTFSEAIDNDLNKKYSKEELIKVAHNCALELCKEMGTQLKMMNLDFDEQRLHFQMFFKNFDDAGASIYYKHKNTQFLEHMQDVGFKHFKVLGMNRGISKNKELQGVVDYKTTKQFHQKELIAINNEISLKKQEIQSIDTNIKELKSLRNSISNDNNLAKNEKKKVYVEITKTQKQLRSLRKDFQIEKKVILDEKEKLNTLFKKYHSKLSNNETLKESILKEFSSYIMIKASNERLKSKNKELENQIQHLQKLTKSKLDFQNLLLQEQEKTEYLTSKIIILEDEIAGKSKIINKLDDENNELRSKLQNINDKEKEDSFSNNR